MHGTDFTSGKSRKMEALEFDREFNRLANHPEVRKMRLYSQHGTSNSYAHSVRVALASKKAAEKLSIPVNGKALAAGAMLHDFYLYDIEESRLSAWQHGTRHPKVSLENAKSMFDLTEKECNIIYSHMWPLTLTCIPKSREAWLVCMADKMCALEEMMNRFAKQKR